MTTPRVLILAVGDPQDGDDGLGPALLAELGSLPVARSWWLTLQTDACLQVEHVLDLGKTDLAIFIHCSRDASAPFEFREVTLDGRLRVPTLNDTLLPSDILHTLSSIGRRQSLPATFGLTLHGDAFNGQTGLSAAARAGLGDAVTFVQDLLTAPDAAGWREKLTG